MIAQRVRKRCHSHIPDDAEHLEWHRHYYRANRERIRAAARARYYRDRREILQQKRTYHLRARYGISLDAYEVLLKKQRGRCAICRMKPNGQRLGVNHHHRAGRVRGLLCFSCNYRLGQLETAWYKRALAYLRRR